jgi:translation elongation factor EF-4
MGTKIQCKPFRNIYFNLFYGAYFYVRNIHDPTLNALEIWQDAIVEVPEVYVGAVVDLLGKRRGQMLDMSTSG